jgi:hypothetical protein
MAEVAFTSLLIAVLGLGIIIGWICGAVDVDCPGLPQDGPLPETRGQMLAMPLYPLGYVLGRATTLGWRRTKIGEWLRQPLRKPRGPHGS